MAAKEFEVLYTHQKTKKSKVWQDGSLKLLSGGTKSVLFDEKHCRLDTVFVRACDVAPGEQLESDRYLILVEQEKMTPSHEPHQPVHVSHQPVQSPSSVPGCESHSQPVTPCHWQSSKRPLAGKCVVAGLKRKKCKFIPPRVVKQSDETLTSQPSCPSPTPTTDPYLNKLHQTPQYNCDNIMTMYSKSHTSQDFPTSKTHDESNISPQLTSFMSRVRTQANKTPDQSPRQTPWTTFGSPSMSSPSYSPLSSNSVSNSQEEKTESNVCGPGMKYSVKTLGEKLLKQDERNVSRCPGNSNIQTQNESHASNISNNSSDMHSNVTLGLSATKRTASQILALLKNKDTKTSMGCDTNISVSNDTKASVGCDKKTLGCDTKASMGYDTKASMGYDTKASMGYDTKASMGYDTKASMGYNTKALVVCDANKLGCDTKASMGYDAKASMGYDTKASMGYDTKASMCYDTKASMGYDTKASMGYNTKALVVSDANKLGCDTKASMSYDTKVSMGYDTKVSMGYDTKASMGYDTKASMGYDTKASMGYDTKASMGYNTKALVVCDANTLGCDIKASMSQDSKGSVNLDTKVSVRLNNKASKPMNTKESVNVDSKISTLTFVSDSCLSQDGESIFSEQLKTVECSKSSTCMSPVFNNDSGEMMSDTDFEDAIISPGKRINEFDDDKECLNEVVFSTSVEKHIKSLSPLRKRRCQENLSSLDEKVLPQTNLQKFNDADSDPQKCCKQNEVLEVHSDPLFCEQNEALQGHSDPLFCKQSEALQGNPDAQTNSKQNEFFPGISNLQNRIKQNEALQGSSDLETYKNNEVLQADSAVDAYFEITFSPLSNISTSEDECDVHTETSQCSHASVFDDSFSVSSPLTTDHPGATETKQSQISDKLNYSDKPSSSPSRTTDSYCVNMETKQENAGKSGLNYFHSNNGSRTCSASVHDDTETCSLVHDDKRTSSPDMDDDTRACLPDVYDDKRTSSPDMDDDTRACLPDVCDDKRTLSPDVYDDKRTLSPDMDDDTRACLPDVCDDKRTLSSDVYDDKRTSSPDMDDNTRACSSDVYANTRTLSSDMYEVTKTCSNDVHEHNTEETDSNNRCCASVEENTVSDNTGHMLDSCKSSFSPKHDMSVCFSDHGLSDDRLSVPPQEQQSVFSKLSSDKCSSKSLCEKSGMTANMAQKSPQTVSIEPGLFSQDEHTPDFKDQVNKKIASSEIEKNPGIRKLDVTNLHKSLASDLVEYTDPQQKSSKYDKIKHVTSSIPKSSESEIITNTNLQSLGPCSIQDLTSSTSKSSSDTITHTGSLQTLRPCSIQDEISSASKSVSDTISHTRSLQTLGPCSIQDVNPSAYKSSSDTITHTSPLQTLGDLDFSPDSVNPSGSQFSQELSASFCLSSHVVRNRKTSVCTLKESPKMSQSISILHMDKHDVPMSHYNCDVLNNVYETNSSHKLKQTMAVSEHTSQGKSCDLKPCTSKSVIIENIKFDNADYKQTSVWDTKETEECKQNITNIQGSLFSSWCSLTSSVSDPRTIQTNPGLPEKYQSTNVEFHSQKSCHNITESQRRNCNSESLFFQPVLQQGETAQRNHDAESLFITTFKSSNISSHTEADGKYISAEFKQNNSSSEGKVPVVQSESSFINPHNSKTEPHNHSVSRDSHEILSGRNKRAISADQFDFHNNSRVQDGHEILSGRNQRAYSADQFDFHNNSRVQDGHEILSGRNQRANSADQFDFHNNSRVQDGYQSLFVEDKEHSVKQSEEDSLSGFSNAEHAIEYPQMLTTLPHPSRLSLGRKKLTNNAVEQTNITDGATSKLAEYKMKGSRSGRAIRRAHDTTFVQVRRQNPNSSVLDISRQTQTQLDESNFTFKPQRDGYSENIFWTSPSKPNIEEKSWISDVEKYGRNSFSSEPANHWSPHERDDTNLKHRRDDFLTSLPVNSQQVRKDLFDDGDRLLVAHTQSTSTRSTDSIRVPDIGLHVNTEIWKTPARHSSPDNTEESFYVDWNEGKAKVVDDSPSSDLSHQIYHVPHTDEIVSVTTDPSPSVCQLVPSDAGISDSPQPSCSGTQNMIRTQRRKQPLKTKPFDDAVTHTTTKLSSIKLKQDLLCSRTHLETSAVQQQTEHLNVKNYSDNNLVEQRTQNVDFKIGSYFEPQQQTEHLNVKNYSDNNLVEQQTQNVDFKNGSYFEPHNRTQFELNVDQQQIENFDQNGANSENIHHEIGKHGKISKNAHHFEPFHPDQNTRTGFSLFNENNENLSSQDFDVPRYKDIKNNSNVKRDGFADNVHSEQVNDSVLGTTQCHKQSVNSYSRTSASHKLFPPHDMDSSSEDDQIYNKSRWEQYLQTDEFAEFQYQTQNNKNNNFNHTEITENRDSSGDCNLKNKESEFLKSRLSDDCVNRADNSSLENTDRLCLTNSSPVIYLNELNESSQPNKLHSNMETMSVDFLKSDETEDKMLQKLQDDCETKKVINSDCFSQHTVNTLANCTDRMSPVLFDQSQTYNLKDLKTHNVNIPMSYSPLCSQMYYKQNFKTNKTVAQSNTSLCSQTYNSEDLKTNKTVAQSNTQLCSQTQDCESVVSQKSRRVGLGKFRNPVQSSVSSRSVLPGSQRNLCGDLQFPSKSEVENEVTPLRQLTIPISFPNVNTYKHTLTAALKEHINVMLFELSKTFYSALQRADLSSYTSSGTDRSKCLKDTNHANTPHCQCGVPAKMIQVKKDGANKGRFFYTCNAPRNQQCKFFQWADQAGKSMREGPVSSGIRLGDADSITTFFRGHGIMFFCECQFLRKIPGHYRKKSLTKGFPAWARSNESEKKLMYIRLSRKGTSSQFSKDDLWIVSQNLNFDAGTTFLAKSMYFGPSSANELEIDPISGYSPSNWSNECVCHAILAGNASTELSCMLNIQDYVQPTIPVLKYILNKEAEKSSDRRKEFVAPAQKSATVKICVPGHLVITVQARSDQSQGSFPMEAGERVLGADEGYGIYKQMEIASDYVNKYKLNSDQTQALMNIADMMNVDLTESDSIVLVHGVFGAGKSFLLSVIIRFLIDIFEMNDRHATGEPFPWKLLISSTTNVAVDRVLMGLLDLGFEDFVRVGSLKKIAKPVLPYSVHATGTDSQELKDLQEMFRSEITPSEKQYVRRSIEKHRLGENQKQLSRVRVVGVTCAAARFQCLAKMTFPFVLLDECSQMTEPSSLLPIARFSCEKLVLVGDPKQLDPTIQGSEAAHKEGLEQTMFDRLMKMGYSPIILRTQYRCHPQISAISNHLFYSGQLRDGITQQCRQPLSETFPTLCFYDVTHGKECDDGSGSFYNESEAQLVALMIDTLVVEGVEPAMIGVITLYKAQVQKVTALLHTGRGASHKELSVIQVSTVDAFQGGERDIIILSCVRSNSLGFIDSDKRMNVALTRARHHLLIVGNLKNLSRNNLWSKVLQHCEENPAGIQKGERVEKQLQSIVAEHKTSQESNSEHKTNRVKITKRKRTNENESPPMSLSDNDFENSASPLVDEPCHQDDIDLQTPITISAENKDVIYHVVENMNPQPSRKRLKTRDLLCPILPDSDTDDDLPPFL